MHEYLFIIHVEICYILLTYPLFFKFVLNIFYTSSIPYLLNKPPHLSLRLEKSVGGRGGRAGCGFLFCIRSTQTPKKKNGSSIVLVGINWVCGIQMDMGWIGEGGKVREGEP